jgi:hypothetical protein
MSIPAPIETLDVTGNTAGAETAFPEGSGNQAATDTMEDLRLEHSGLLRDRRTGLEWTAKYSGSLPAWKDAEKYCATLGKRLPSPHEFQTIYRVEYS